MDANRGSASARGYGRAWQRLRLLKLRTDPVCECGCGGMAEEVDHKLPLEDGGTNEWSNLQSLTKACHSRKTQRDVAARRESRSRGAAAEA